MHRFPTAFWILIVTWVCNPVARAEQEYGLGKLVPGRYLNAVRQGTADKLPQIPQAMAGEANGAGNSLGANGSTTDPVIDPAIDSVPMNFPVVNAARVPGSVPNVAVPRPAGVASTGNASSAAAAQSSSFASYQSAAPYVPVGSVPNLGAQSDLPSAQQQVRPVANLPGGASGFLAGSLGDTGPDDLQAAGGVTGLGAGWSAGGSRQVQPRRDDFGSDPHRDLSVAGAPASPREGAANRLLASVQDSASGEESPQQVAQQMDSNMQSDGYRALKSVLAFQDLPRGVGGSEPGPKQLWANPDPKRVKSSPSVLNTLHSKEPIGQAAAAFRRSSAGAVDGSVPGLVSSTRGGDAGGIGQTGGIYQSGSASGGASAPAPAAAVPFQFKFPLPGADAGNADFN
jgi:hypothetical protein